MMNNKLSRGFVFLLGLGTLSACQIHKPVPVEHVSVQHPRAQYQYPQYSNAPQYPRTMSSVARQGQSSSLQPTEWQPIDIVPLAQTVEAPTQPMREYEFKPRPKAATSDGRSHYTRPVSVTANNAGDVHVVQPGESLYSIARAYGMSVNTLATRNNVSAPFEIFPGQRIYLTRQAGISSPAISTPPVSNSDIKWAWPVRGNLLSSFRQDESKGIEIDGSAGTIVRAAADGVVLYSGNKVTGYGELVIIDHGQGYMSTYAHNRTLLVKQGQQVKRGDKIAEMGSSDADRIKLHFEIRKREKPVNPLAYLPK